MPRKFKEYTKLDLNECAKVISKYWKKNSIFKKSINLRQGKNAYIFYEGPPSANGKPGIHHVMSRTIKDVFCRYHTLKGEQVHRKAGWDTHGLPIELAVEKALNITKEDIGDKITVDEYNKFCRQSVQRYTEIWKNLTNRIGYWVDQEHAYITSDSKYIETVWWILKQFYLKGLLYKGYKVQPYSPSAGTGLSTHELNMPGAYQEIIDTTIIAQFKARKDSLPNFLQNLSQEVYFLAWTTTPWTLPSNTALTIGPKIEYLLAETFNPYTFEHIYVIFAKNLLKQVFSNNFLVTSKIISPLDNFNKKNNKIPYRIINFFRGEKILGSRYEQLLSWALPYKNSEDAFQIIPGEFVNIQEGTGIVHTAPTFGIDDAAIAKKNNIPSMLVWDAEQKKAIPLVDMQGRFIRLVPEPFCGRYIRNEYDTSSDISARSVNVELAILLKEQGRAFKVEKYKHSYPHCWRTKKPILFYPLNSWFIKTSLVKSDMVKLNDTIRWIPASTGQNRFGHWLNNINDWNLSRSRYWGVPLPIWHTEDYKEKLIIGSVEELLHEINKSIKRGFMVENPFQDFIPGNMSQENYNTIDLHKPIVDQIILVSPNGHPMQRELDLIDVWFDSGAMPFAQYHYPFENKKKIETKKLYPADFIAEGVDQTRGWFYTLHAISSILFKSVAYKNVISHGLVLDQYGQKMSKSKDSSIDPFHVLDLYGPDATRWYMMSNAHPWENFKFDLEGVNTVRKKFFSTLYNIYAFFSLYANIDGFCYQEDVIPVSERSELDRWILSELNQLIKKVQDNYENYDATRATRSINDFVIKYLSNWYIRLSRRRFWKEDYSYDKIMGYQTLYEILLAISFLSAPIAPFFSDRLYIDLSYVRKNAGFESVHLGYFPKYNEKMIDILLEKRMNIVQKLASMVLFIRKKEKIKVRQPLNQLIILASKSDNETSLRIMSNILKQEINVKEINFLTSKTAEKLLIREIRPNFKKLGPKYGQNINLISKALSQLSQHQIFKFEDEGRVSLEIRQNKIILLLKEVHIFTREVKGEGEWSVHHDETLTIALDIKIDQNLRYEGLARELVNRIQNIRKAHGLKVTEKIILTMSPSPELEKAIILNKIYICDETLSTSLLLKQYNSHGEKIEFEGETVIIFLQKSNYL